MNEIPKSQPIFSKHNADWKKLLEREYIKPYTTHVKFKKKKLSPNILYVVTYIHTYVENVQKHSQEKTCTSEESYICEGATLLIPIMSIFVRYLDKYFYDFIFHILK